MVGEIQALFSVMYQGCVIIANITD